MRKSSVKKSAKKLINDIYIVRYKKNIEVF